MLTTSQISALDAIAAEEKSHFRFTRHGRWRQFEWTVLKRIACAVGREGD
jgi:hypothetical protein